uniref:Uncharacterized protein n=1 Tax=Romanomermis culicivorax TaxID=13658 RepID=A0A915HM76_ROMCU
MSNSETTTGFRIEESTMISAGFNADSTQDAGTDKAEKTTLTTTIADDLDQSRTTIETSIVDSSTLEPSDALPLMNLQLETSSVKKADGFASTTIPVRMEGPLIDALDTITDDPHTPGTSTESSYLPGRSAVEAKGDWKQEELLPETSSMKATTGFTSITLPNMVEERMLETIDGERPAVIHNGTTKVSQYYSEERPTSVIPKSQEETEYDDYAYEISPDDELPLYQYTRLAESSIKRVITETDRTKYSSLPPEIKPATTNMPPSTKLTTKRARVQQYLICYKHCSNPYIEYCRKRISIIKVPYFLNENDPGDSNKIGFDNIDQPVFLNCRSLSGHCKELGSPCDASDNHCRLCGRQEAYDENRLEDPKDPSRNYRCAENCDGRETCFADDSCTNHHSCKQVQEFGIFTQDEYFVKECIKDCWGSPMCKRTKVADKNLYDPRDLYRKDALPISDAISYSKCLASKEDCIEVPNTVPAIDSTGSLKFDVDQSGIIETDSSPEPIVIHETQEKQQYYDPDPAQKGKASGSIHSSPPSYNAYNSKILKVQVPLNFQFTTTPPPTADCPLDPSKFNDGRQRCLHLTAFYEEVKYQPPKTFVEDISKLWNLALNFVGSFFTHSMEVHGKVWRILTSDSEMTIPERFSKAAAEFYDGDVCLLVTTDLPVKAEKLAPFITYF